MSKNQQLLSEAISLSQSRVARLEAMLHAAGSLPGSQQLRPAAGDALSPSVLSALPECSRPPSPLLDANQNGGDEGGRLLGGSVSTAPLESIELRRSKGGFARVTGVESEGRASPPPALSLPPLQASHPVEAPAARHLPSVADLYPAFRPAPATPAKLPHVNTHSVGSSSEGTTENGVGRDEGGWCETEGEGYSGNLHGDAGKGGARDVVLMEGAGGEMRLSSLMEAYRLGRQVDSDPPSPAGGVGLEVQGEEGKDETENLEWRHSLWLRTESDEEDRISV